MVRYEIRHSLTATLQVLRWCDEKRDTYMFIGPRVVVGDVRLPSVKHRVGQGRDYLCLSPEKKSIYT